MVNIDTIFSNLNIYEQDLQNVNVATYPFLKLEYITKDDKNRTSPHLPYWKVLFDGFPELVVDGSNGFEFYKDTLNQGENMKVKFNVLNASNITVPMFDVDFTVKQPENKISQSTKSISSLTAFGSKATEFIYNTTPYFGDHSLLISIDKSNITKDIIKSNNVSSKNFYVSKDKSAPLLDVTFDGVHIMNEDLVSAKPQINILVKDEASFLTLDDLSLLEVKLFTDRNKEIPILQNEIKLVKTENQKMQVLYTPTLNDGDYRLEVQARDKSGNKSGLNPYSINFKVINTNSVSQVLNYPNPFSTSTQFVFTLTGSEIPENISISIYTLSGKVVKEITKQDLGPLRIGINRTEYKWDGTDDFGSKLANGVYLYKVNFKDKDGKSYENFKTKTDTLFKDGFGKMVIIR
jgi:flagellar hook assembly protein FlgD